MNRRILLDSLTYQLILLRTAVENLEKKRKNVEDWFETDEASEEFLHRLWASNEAVWNVARTSEKLVS